DYFAHWLDVGESGGKMPKIFYVNWFRKNAEGKFLWPGFAENSRVLKWVFERCDEGASAVETPLGLMPGPNSLDTDGLDIDDADMAELLRIDIEGWKAEIPLIKEHYETFGDRLPQGLRDELAALEQRLG
ncbi:MAG: phosphoenolpyruvate carboxykinase domain-containing protein, partial [Pseudomonadota bacterium]